MKSKNYYNMCINDTNHLKSKTQNYINLNIRNFYSNKKLSTNPKIFADKSNNSYENNKFNNNLLDSKKKLFTKNLDNNIHHKPAVNHDNKQTKKTSALNNNINLQKKSNLLINIFSTKKLLRTTSPRNRNINKIIKKQSKNFNNNKNVNQTNDNNLTLTQEKANSENI